MKLTTREVSLSDKRQLSTNIHKKKHWSVSLWKRPNRQNRNRQTVHMRALIPTLLNWGWSECQRLTRARAVRVQAMNPTFRLFNLTIGSLVFLFFFPYFSKKNVTESFCISALSLPAFATCLSHSSLVWHWHIKQKEQEELCHLS